MIPGKNTLNATLEGVGFWCNGLPSWADAQAFVRDGTRPDDAPARPSPQLLAPNERRRAPESVAVALEVAFAACQAAGRDPATLPSVFASTHGDLSITDYICSTLASDPASVSPTRFHNSVHNAAAGYWTIGTGCTEPATALSAYDASFAQGLVEAMAQLHAGAPAVLLVAYDTAAPGPFAPISNSSGLLGAALVLSSPSHAGAPRLRTTLVDADAPPPQGPLAGLAGGNAMAPMLPLFQALASGHDLLSLHAGPRRALRVEIAYG
ncbi:MAG TPA: beta-ketoacyl synthase chain length factor [Xanthomonadaceae bacterium]|nr:beta-ketoacyl synthase chain length factor [Xanthomonadaceae bacterium]